MAEDTLARALKSRRQISITVTGRRSGRSIKLPVWFVFEDNKLWLLPVYGSETQWYRNLLAHPAITIQVGGESRTLRARAVREAGAVSKVVRGFREKYTPEQIARWYSSQDVTVEVAIQSIARRSARTA